MGLLVHKDKSQFDKLRGTDVNGELVVVCAAEERNGLLRDGGERVSGGGRGLTVFGAHFGVGFVIACDGAGGIAVKSGAVGPGGELGANACDVGGGGLEGWVKGVIG